jgi:hypothetical protein
MIEKVSENINDKVNYRWGEYCSWTLSKTGDFDMHNFFTCNKLSHKQPQRDSLIQYILNMSRCLIFLYRIYNLWT